MENQKICFIMCINNSQYAEEALYYINRLQIPEGYSIDTLVMKDAKGMAEGYNKAMNSSDAKYKIYLHQDVFIVEPQFIEKLLSIFENPEVGMIGIVGSPKLPESGVMWYAPCIGKIYVAESDSIWLNNVGEISGTYQSVEMVDGLLMATQYDIPWREDIFQKWDFYDASQSQEFIRAGFKIVVPQMDKPWCIHDCGITNLENYWMERKKFICEYKGLQV